MDNINNLQLSTIHNILEKITKVKVKYQELVEMVPFFSIGHTVIKSLNVCANNIVINDSFVFTYNAQRLTVNFIHPNNSRYTVQVSKKVIEKFQELGTAIRDYSSTMFLTGHLY